VGDLQQLETGDLEEELQKAGMGKIAKTKVTKALRKG